ncbi:MAG: anthranilate phosphoribosyltransferase [Bryobacteraceae bacterium]
MPFLAFLHRAASRENLTALDAQQAMELILSGQATTAQIAAFLIALRMKGETPDEILGFARAMRERSASVMPKLNGEALIDTCGTGGDGQNTFNISTVTAFVVSGAGVKVAKHGNRSLASLCGSADIFEGLGINIALTPERTAESIREVGIGFLYAPAMHPAMKYAQAARSELKMRTAFNLLGPLTNPAGATVQLVGAPSTAAAELMAEALASLGLQRGFVVHGSGGLDEISTTGESLVLEIQRGAIAHHTLTPRDFGVKTAKMADLRGGGLDENLAIARAILDGEAGPKRDIVLVNASAALVVAGKAASFLEGVELAAESIDSGRAREKVEQMARFSQVV